MNIREQVTKVIDNCIISDFVDGRYSTKTYADQILALIQTPEVLKELGLVKLAIPESEKPPGVISYQDFTDRLQRKEQR